MSEIAKFVINLSKIMEKAEKIPKMIQIMIEIGPQTSNQEIWSKK